MTSSGGESRPGGRVVAQKTTADAQTLQERLLATVAVPDDARVWVQVAYEDGAGEVVVRVGHADVQGEVRLPIPANLAAVLEELVGAHAEAARADLRRGIVQGLVAVMARPPEEE